ncbi:nucleic acid/nucleotide deaminase domain-containing protein [Streptomyces kronopolitis]|uniref:nucleic acid/nucleotide deaminase domain-containing protein n=1 Tax=Streptomyces kronopolitis TaxID=1612435 RepID=UPI003D96ADA4
MRNSEDALRSFSSGTGSDAGGAHPSVQRIAQITVPLQVGPYFATSPDEAVPLHEYADSVGRRVMDESCRTWARLGSDRGFEICADHEGAVHAVLLDLNEAVRPVNSTPEAFAESLGVLDQALGAILTADSPHTAQSDFEQLEQRLWAIDRSAFAERENWWPLVLDDIRDTASTEWFAAFEVVDGQGEKQILTASGGVGVHPEEKLWQQLRSAGVQPEQVLRIHTDLEACFMPGHYCSLWLGDVFSEAELTHNFPYGETAASRAEGIQQLREAAAERSSQ